MKGVIRGPAVQDAVSTQGVAAGSQEGLFAAWPTGLVGSSEQAAAISVGKSGWGAGGLPLRYACEPLYCGCFLWGTDGGCLRLSGGLRQCAGQGKGGVEFDRR